MTQIHHDVLIIGSGAAGMSLALHLSSKFSVALVSKASLESGSTPHAQGGVAAVFDEMDSIESHVTDTLKAGDGLCDEPIVRKVVEDSTPAIQWLIDLGVPFDKSEAQKGKNRFHLTKEGGHSRRRVLHSADETGKAIGTTLLTKCVESTYITCYSNYMAVDLITDPTSNSCSGAYMLNTLSGKVTSFSASITVLATGGASKAYLYSSNPDGASGDGIALAWRAGCSVKNMELNQFHPTCLYHPDNPSFLITEAIRGEGGILTLPSGKRFMPEHDERAELAPRDVVARAIDHEMKKHGLAHVLLDISHKPEAFIKQHFPMIYDTCLRVGIDITSQPIPVVPAAHYTCGGVQTDEHGKTSLSNLFAIGEVACTGLHGANRMASNSLLECISFARFAAAAINSQPLPAKKQVPNWDSSKVTESSESILLEHNWEAVRRIMWNYVGIVRKTERLERAKKHISLLLQEAEEYYRHYKISPDLMELRNLSLIAKLIIDSALKRKESRGLHYTLDYPDKASSALDTLLIP